MNRKPAKHSTALIVAASQKAEFLLQACERISESGVRGKFLNRVCWVICDHEDYGDQTLAIDDAKR
jgi:hypothetical protein